MISAAWILLGVVALLTFWMVGAHNRLVALRNTIVTQFGPVDEQFRARQLLLREQSEAIAAWMQGSTAPLDALNAALTQADAACAHARSHPGAAGATASLRLADEILEAARSRLPADALAASPLAEIQLRLIATQASLDFTRGRFNDAVGEYNAAVRQFPTWIVAAMFGFRPAGPL